MHIKNVLNVHCGTIDQGGINENDTNSKPDDALLRRV
jgi:hypothetical protein